MSKKNGSAVVLIAAGITFWLAIKEKVSRLQINPAAISSVIGLNRTRYQSTHFKSACHMSSRHKSFSYHSSNTIESELSAHQSMWLCKYARTRHAFTNQLPIASAPIVIACEAPSRLCRQFIARYGRARYVIAKSGLNSCGLKKSVNYSKVRCAEMIRTKISCIYTNIGVTNFYNLMLPA